MSLIEDNIDEVNDTIDDAVNKFLAGVDKSEKGMFNKLFKIVKELETNPDGSIKQTVKNLKLLARVRNEIQQEIVTDAYISRVGQFENEFAAVQALNNDYFSAFIESFNPNRQLYKEVRNNAINSASASLLEAGLEENVVNPIIKILNDSVTDGASFTDMVDELRLRVKGDAETMGQLRRYASQITRDAINQFNASYNQTIAKDLDLEWFFYSGGKRKTSRPFCKKYAGRYFHKKEVEDFGNKKDLDGSNLCGGNYKTDLCAGRIKGTNSSNIFRYRGGYQCRHIYKATLITAVPKHVIRRNIKKGYYEPEEVIAKEEKTFPPLKKDITTSQLIKTAEKEGDALQSTAEGIAKKHNATTTPLNLKSEASIKRKIAADKGTPADIKDAVRTTIIAPKSKIDDIIKEYESRGLAARVKRQSTDAGYTGTIINVYTDGGILGEVQVNTAKMIYAKEEFAKSILGDKTYNAIKNSSGLKSGQGHTLYERSRVLEALASPTKAELKELEGLLDKSKEYYSNFQ